jgi:hypothetical protein
MEKPVLAVGVVMQRRAAQSRWADYVWEPVSVVTGPQATGSEPQLIADNEGVLQWLHPGFRIVLHKDEAEGYYLNCAGEAPKVFVLWRMDDERALPVEVTASFEEAGRWLDAGHSVDGVPITPEIFSWVGQYVEANYRPQPQKRIKPRSFVHPRDRR